MKIKISKNQWEEAGKKAKWAKEAQVTPQQGQDNKQMTIINNALQTVEMQSNTMPLNGQKIRVLLGQIRELVKTDPSIAQ